MCLPIAVPVESLQSPSNCFTAEQSGMSESPVDALVNLAALRLCLVSWSCSSRVRRISTTRGFAENSAGEMYWHSMILARTSMACLTSCGLAFHILVRSSTALRLAHSVLAGLLNGLDCFSSCPCALLCVCVHARVSATLAAVSASALHHSMPAPSSAERGALTLQSLAFSLSSRARKPAPRTLCQVTGPRCEHTGGPAAAAAGEEDLLLLLLRLGSRLGRVGGGGGGGVGSRGGLHHQCACVCVCVCHQFKEPGQPASPIRLTNTRCQRAYQTRVACLFDVRQVAQGECPCGLDLGDLAPLVCVT
jgi:hypothetical protein